MPPVETRRHRTPRLLKFRLQDLALNFLPGLLAGAQLAGLLFFLNPEVPFGWTELLRVGGALGCLGGVVSTTVLSFFTWSRPGLARRQLPWVLVAVLALSAIVDWVQASSLDYFIPPGINRRLIKAAIGLSIATVVCFYTSLLHAVPPRAYGRRSIALFVLLSLSSVYVLGERRTAFQPQVPVMPLPSSLEIAPRLNLVVVGLTGATLDAILPLAEQGQLPFFLRLIEQGAYGRLTSFPPTAPDALWTSLATGRYPHRHGVSGHWVYRAPLLFGEDWLRLLPGSPSWNHQLLPGVSRRRLDANMRRNPALWEIFDRLGVPSGIIGWPAVSAARGAPSFVFSDTYFEGDFSATAGRPPELAERGVLFQVASNELGAETIAPFGDNVPELALAALADDLWRQTLTLFLLDQRQETRALFLLLPGLGEVSRLTFGGYTAYHLDGHQQDTYRQAAQNLTAYYRQLDSFLEQLWQRIPGTRMLAVASPFGVAEPRGWRRLVKTVTGRASEGSFHPTSDGALFLLGDGIQANRFLDEAGVLDVMPTLLYAAGCPIGRDLDGRVLISAFDSSFLAQTPLTFVPSYETLTADRATR
ncbi:MAG: alkaline phosphatase family protein [Acidobacteriota bacterium]|nr:alkaline phosphatase family protein [Acidobacteriota bacterium]